MIPKIKKVNLSEQLTETMLELIENGTWQPGDKLPNEVDLAASFDVSRNIMRESMKILESYGIFSKKTGVGTYIEEDAIAKINSIKFLNVLKENYSVNLFLETRLVIEPAMAYYAALRATDEEKKELRRIVETDIRIHDETNFFQTNDFGFHEAVAHYSHNPILENLLITLLSQLSEEEYKDFNKYVEDTVKREASNDHVTMLEAIEAGDAEKARSTMYDHLYGRLKVINPEYK